VSLISYNSGAGQRTGRDASVSTEAHRAVDRTYPVEGVLYEPLSRRAKVLDTGLEVFEVVRMWQIVGRDWERLTAAHHWLTFHQLRTALEFYEKNPAIVEARLTQERECRAEDTGERYPASRPPRR
jgi:uncharacterized protein (DUF433 family)